MKMVMLLQPSFYRAGQSSNQERAWLADSCCDPPPLLLAQVAVCM
jgi:hypothetical protein